MVWDGKSVARAMRRGARVRAGEGGGVGEGGK